MNNIADAAATRVAVAYRANLANGRQVEMLLAMAAKFATPSNPFRILQAAHADVDPRTLEIRH